jgi:cholesterol transport system auxiliary component
VRLRPQLGGLLLCLLASGCGGLLHSTARPEQTYYLRAPAAAAARAAVAHAAGTDAQSGAMSLRVAHPNAAPGLESPHIMLLQSDYRMDFFTGVRWPASTPEVIESLVVQTLRASGDWSSVADPGSPFPSDFLLQIGVQRFEADYTGGGAAPVVHVVLDCILGRREGRDVIATFVASGEANAAANRVSAVVGAFEQATDAALDSLAQQAAQAARAAQQRAPQNGENPVPSMKR